MVGFVQPSYFFFIGPLPNIEKSRLVNEYVNEYGEWNWSAFNVWLPNATLLHMAAMLPPHASAGDDMVFWNTSSSRQFQVREAFEVEIWSPGMHGIVNGIVSGNGMDQKELKLSFGYVFMGGFLPMLNMFDDI